MQFDDGAAADGIELLGFDVQIAVGGAFLTEGGQHEALTVVEDAEGGIVDDQTDADDEDNHAAADQQPAVAESCKNSGDAQGDHDGAEGGITLVDPDGQARMMLGLIAEQLLKALVKQIANAKDQHGNDNYSQILHSKRSPLYAQRTQSTGMSNSSVSRWGSIWNS